VPGRITPRDGQAASLRTTQVAPAELRYTRAGFMKKAAVTTAVLGLAYVWMRRRRDR